MQLVVARVGRAHGVRGEVSVEVRTDEPELRLAPGAVLATDPAAAGPLTIATGRVHSGRLVLRFEGVDDRSGAEALRNVLLIAEVDPEELPDDPDEFYDHQLMDLDVVLADGTPVGRITEISHLPAQDLFIVERPDGGEVMIPFVEEIVTEIDLEQQRAVIEPPPGLIDPAEAETAAAAGGDTRDDGVGDAYPEARKGDGTVPGVPARDTKDREARKGDGAPDGQTDDPGPEPATGDTLQDPGTGKAGNRRNPAESGTRRRNPADDGTRRRNPAEDGTR